MKKVTSYLIPALNIMQIQHEAPLATSGVTSSYGISYGGVDEEGTLAPSVKGNPFGASIFEEE